MKPWIDADAARFVSMARTTLPIDTGGHGEYGAREKQAFVNALDRAVTRALRPPK